jgi:phage terminase small subunit
MRLKNTRHEAFAQLVSIGSTATAAYIEAGFSSNSAGQGGERLTRNPAVAARIEELRADTERLMTMKRMDYLIELKNRFMELPPEDPVTAKYGEMLARAMGWNEPEKVDIASAMDIRIRIGGTGDPIAG